MNYFTETVFISLFVTWPLLFGERDDDDDT